MSSRTRGRHHRADRTPGPVQTALGTAPDPGPGELGLERRDRPPLLWAAMRGPRLLRGAQCVFSVPAQAGRPGRTMACFNNFVYFSLGICLGRHMLRNTYFASICCVKTEVLLRSTSDLQSKWPNHLVIQISSFLGLHNGLVF